MLHIHQTSLIQLHIGHEKQIFDSDIQKNKKLKKTTMTNKWMDTLSDKIQSQYLLTLSCTEIQLLDFVRLTQFFNNSERERIQEKLTGFE